MTISKSIIAESFELTKDVQFSIIDTLKKHNVYFTKNFANSGTLYIGLIDGDGNSFKLRVANHSKGRINYCGRECDGNIIYSDDMDSCDIENLLMEELPWEMELND